MLSGRALPIAVLVLLALVPGAGCGSSGENSSTQPPPGAANQAPAGDQALSASGEKPQTGAKGSSPSANDGGKRKRSSEDKARKQDNEDGRASTDSTKKSSAGAPDADSPCPDGVSRDRCREMIRSSENAQRTSKPVPEDRCPPSYSKAECAAAVQAWEEAQAGSHPQEPGQCPPAVSRDDCEAIAREAGY